jgi:hypothetical protein
LYKALASQLLDFRFEESELAEELGEDILTKLYKMMKIIMLNVIDLICKKQLLNMKNSNTFLISKTEDFQRIINLLRDVEENTAAI